MTGSLDSPLFHVTQIVDTLESAFDSHRRLFYRPVSYGGYWDVCERSAIATFVGDVIVEGMVPHRRKDGSYSFAGHDLAAFLGAPGGGHLHSLAWYARDINDLAARLRAWGVRFTDTEGHPIEAEVPTHGPIPVVPGSSTKYPPGWNSAVLYSYFEDCAGMIELCEPSSYHPGMAERRSGKLPQPAADPDTPVQGWRASDPLGVKRVSHQTIVVPDARHACRFFTEVFDGRLISEGESQVMGAKTITVSVGKGIGTVLELAEPVASGPARADLEAFGHGILHRCTFLVEDLGPVRDHLAREEFPVEAQSSSLVVVDPAGAAGSRFGFTTEDLSA
jgi:catechol 2,3-dioxygenase-like lactoylglutathione lyase family enzyme